MNFETMPDAVARAPILVNAPQEQATAKPDDAIVLNSCAQLDWIVVRTRHNVYDVIVLSGETGDVIVRGGRFFPEFRRATVAGSIFGRSAVKVRAICAGLHLELHVEGQALVTSRIEAVSRHRPYIAEGTRRP